MTGKCISKIVDKNYIILANVSIVTLAKNTAANNEYSVGNSKAFQAGITENRGMFVQSYETRDVEFRTLR